MLQDLSAKDTLISMVFCGYDFTDVFSHSVENHFYGIGAYDLQPLIFLYALW